ncbi:MAG: hypothetical protein WC915_03040 [archaeon]|jgi:uncharacterized protein (UPF0333 family)
MQTNKGQVSFESLILTLAIITTAAYITILFLQTTDITNGMAIIRSELKEQAIIKNDELIINTVKFGSNQTPTFEITTIPPTFKNADFNIDLLTTKIIQITQFKDVNIVIN